MTVASPRPGRRCAAAILVAETGRYLMQRRDDFAWIQFPGHWGCFGGAIKRGEAPEAALRRELQEEIGYRARDIVLFTDFRLVMPFPVPRREHIRFFTVPIAEAEIAGMVLTEGADLRLFRPEELAVTPRVAPWDLAAVLMHASRELLFREPQRPEAHAPSSA